MGPIKSVERPHFLSLLDGISPNMTLAPSPRFAPLRDSAPTPVRPTFIDTHDGTLCENIQATYLTNSDPSAYAYEWELLDSQGRVVRSAGTPTFRLLGVTVSAGTYTLRVRTKTCREKSAWRATTVVVRPEGSPGCSSCGNPFFGICSPG